MATTKEIAVAVENIIHICDKPNCKLQGIRRFSGWDTEYHCSIDCQKADWKIHKVLCPDMKADGEKLLPFQIIKTIDKLKFTSRALKEGLQSEY